MKNNTDIVPSVHVYLPMHVCEKAWAVNKMVLFSAHCRQKLADTLVSCRERIEQPLGNNEHLGPTRLAKA